MVRAFVFRPLGSESVCPRACGIKVCRALVKGRWHACVPLLLAFFAETFGRAQVSCLTSNSFHCYQRGPRASDFIAQIGKEKESKYLNIVRISRVENLGFHQRKQNQPASAVPFARAFFLFLRRANGPLPHLQPAPVLGGAQGPASHSAERSSAGIR